MQSFLPQYPSVGKIYWQSTWLRLQTRHRFEKKGYTGLEMMTKAASSLIWLRMKHSRKKKPAPHCQPNSVWKKKIWPLACNLGDSKITRKMQTSYLETPNTQRRSSSSSSSNHKHRFFSAAASIALVVAGDWWDMVPFKTCAAPLLSIIVSVDRYNQYTPLLCQCKTTPPTLRYLESIEVLRQNATHGSKELSLGCKRPHSSWSSSHNGGENR